MFHYKMSIPTFVYNKSVLTMDPQWMNLSKSGNFSAVLLNFLVAPLALCISYTLTSRWPQLNPPQWDHRLPPPSTKGKDFLVAKGIAGGTSFNPLLSHCRCSSIALCCFIIFSDRPAKVHITDWTATCPLCIRNTFPLPTPTVSLKLHDKIHLYISNDLHQAHG